MPDSPPEPFLTVVMRTQGRRAHQLAQALDALADQVDPDLEVRLVVHTHGDDVDPGTVGAALAVPAARLGDRLHLHQVDGGRRGVPLNVGIAAARGRYVAFLDDDDLVTSHWVSAFRSGAEREPGRLVRTQALVRDVRLFVADDATIGEEVLGPDTSPFPARFELVAHLQENRTPICSVAIPTTALHAHGAAPVDESLDALEDWDLLLRLAPPLGVVDRPEATSIVRRFVTDGESRRELGEGRWEAAHTTVRDRLRSTALTVHACFAGELVTAAEQLADLHRMAGDLDPGTPGRPMEVLRDTIRRVYAELGAANETTTQLHLERDEHLRTLENLWEQLATAREGAARQASPPAGRRHRR